MTNEGKKVFNDPIHGHIELHPLLVKIIDTPQFQRLRNIKQLGEAYFVYPGASHNRFEHSIGVCHLAGELVEALKSRQPELEITPQDVLCVQIAGLCHDLGHGPFSHLFDGMFIPEARGKKGQQSEKWKHETASVQMFDHLLKNDTLKQEMNKFFQDQDFKEEMASIKTMIEGLPDIENQQSDKGLGEESVKMFHNLVKNNKLEGPMKKIFLVKYKDFLDEDQVFKEEMALIRKVIEGLPDTENQQSGKVLGEESVKMFHNLVKNNKLKETMKKFFQHQVFNKEIVFIEEMIEGLPDTANQRSGKGRGEEKSFLYEIVANKVNGIDVDKFDYFARDCYHLGIQNGFDYHRFIKFARVCEVDGRQHICIRDKEVANVYDMFYTRFRLHKRAYQHRVNAIIQYMISDAFLEADEYIKFTNSRGDSFTLSESINDMEAYVKVTDHVFQQILNTENPDSEDSERLEKTRKDSEDSERRQRTQKAKEILQNIQSRNLYQYLGETRPIQEAGTEKVGQSSVQREMKITETMISEWKKELGELAQNDGLTMDDFVILDSKFDYGMNEKDPVNNTYFYSKRNPTVAFKICREQVSRLLPICFSELLIRVYCKKTDDRSVVAARDRFKRWCQNKGFPMPQDGNALEPEVFGR